MRAHLIILLAILALVAISCDGGDGDSSVGATCQSTCEKATVLGCPNDPATVELCVTQCEDQIAGCSDSQIVQRYLDCAQTTPMMCGDSTGQASSPECLEEGLAYFACLNGITPDTTGGDTADSDTSGGDTTAPAQATISGSGTFDGQALTIGCTEGGSHTQFDHLYGGLDQKTVFYCKVTNTEILNLTFNHTAVGSIPDTHFERTFELTLGNLRVEDAEATSHGLTVSIQVEAWDPDAKTIAGSFSASWTHVYDPTTGMFAANPGELSGTFGGPLDPL